MGLILFMARSLIASLRSQASVMLIDKGYYRHFMAKEIDEQPEVVGHTLAKYLDMTTERVALPMALPFDFRALKRISIAACGTAYYTGMVPALAGPEIGVAALSRPQHQLPDRARRRAQAQGNLLYPCRGLRGGRTQARPDRAHRRDHAGHRDRVPRPRI